MKQFWHRWKGFVRIVVLAALGPLACLNAAAAFAAGDLNVLFLGDNGHHQPHARFLELEPVLRSRDIALTYTDKIDDLNPATLKKYDALLLYANIDHIKPNQERALLDYVEQGHGFVPLHCASFCFQNSDACIQLIGAQFDRHGWARMRETVNDTQHPVTHDYGGFTSWDETYVHRKHNEKDRTVLSYRVEGDKREPWTWVRQQGKGRVFYTAWGHDSHTWNHPGFHNLVERGIRWACGQDPNEAGPYLSDLPFVAPKMKSLPSGRPPFEYVDVGAKIPNYVPSQKWGEQGKPLTTMQKPLRPQESMKRMVVPEGFHVELFASDPDLAGKPICMTWDERGRLWICETVDYPNELQSKNEGRDRIRICEDTDDDGRADKFTVFAEHLSIPTSIAFARGGVIVHNGTETLFLKDTNGDDQADERSVLLSRWSLGDTHGGTSNMQYGLDNWIWGMQGYNKSTIRIGDKSTQFAQGFHRFKPDGSVIEFIRSTDNNTWGFGMSEEGIIFGSTANGDPSVYMPIANRYYERVRGWTPKLTLSTIADSNKFKPITDKVRQVDHHGGYTAAAGHALYTARAYPEKYWNRTAFVCEPTGHLISTFVLSADGADFHSTSPCNLFASDDEWVAPIMAEVGPDGYVWIIDWYNFIVQHNPTPQGFKTGKGAAYESDLRDKTHGRIYRLVCDSAKQTVKPDLTHAKPAEMVAALKNDNLFWRRQAQRLLVERGQLDVVPDLVKLVANLSTDAIGLNVGAIHALWTLKGLGALDGDQPKALASAVAALHHPSAGVRRNAVQVLPNKESSTDSVIQAELLEDSSAQVQLQALLALADLPPSAAAGKAIAQVMSRSENTADRWIMDAATCAAATNALDFLSATTAIKSPSPQLLDTCKIVADHFARTSPGNQTERLLKSLASVEPGLAGAIVAGLSDGWQPGNTFPNDAAAQTAVKKLLSRLRLEDRVHLARLAMRSGDPQIGKILGELTGDLVDRVKDDKLSLKNRIAAAELIVETQPDSDETANQILDFIAPQTPPDLALALIGTLRECSAPSLGATAIERMGTLTPSAREAVLELLLSRRPMTTELLAALEQGKIRVSDLSLVHKQLLNDYPDESLRNRARAIFEQSQGTVSADRKEVLAQFADLANTKGDPASGKEIFTKNCAVCHRYQGQGATVGPDLTGMGVHGKQQLLVHILDPNRDVEGNYQAYIVVLNDGRVLNGLLAGESGTSVDLLDNEGKRRAILREDIDEISRTGKSLMPEGFEKQLSKDQLAGVLEFLTQRTKFVPLDMRRVATVSSASGMFRTPGSDVERIAFNEWDAKTVSGVPFYPIDPQDGRVRNVVMLHGDLGTVPPKMPKSVELQCGMPAKAIHFLSGVSGWGFPASKAGTVSMIVRIHYVDGKTEEESLVNGVHFADYLGHTDVSGSRLAFNLGRQQLRYFSIEPKRSEAIESLELIKGPDQTAPVVMCVTVERK